MQPKRNIFISYKNDGEGRNFAARLSTDLKNRGYSVYYNPDEQHAGSFPKRLRNAVHLCEDFLLVLTQPCLDQLIKYEKIDWVREELIEAHTNKKNIIPLLMPGVSMPKDKGEFADDLRFLADIDSVNISEPYDKSPLACLLSWLKSKPSVGEMYDDTFQSNPDYNVNSDFKNTLQLAKNRDVKAMYEIANMYFYGFTDENGCSSRNFANAYEWFKKVSEFDNEYSVLAMSMIARMYYVGVVPKERQSYTKSLKYHKEASVKSEYSKQHYAFMLSAGLGCEFDYDAAEKHYLESLNSGDNLLINGLAKLYIQYGEFKKAADLYKRIVSTYPMAAYELGCLYMKGVLSDDKKPDCIKAAFYFQHSISSGNCDIDAYYQLGLLYFRGTNGFLVDYKIAEDNFRIAADNGHTTAAYMMGYMYEYGYVEQDTKKAIHYYILAAEHGHVLSPTHLAILYQLPENQNYHEALKYAKMAAELGEKEGEFIYGNMLFFGRGCKADNNEAYKMYKRSYEHGCDQAKFMLERIERINRRVDS